MAALKNKSTKNNKKSIFSRIRLASPKNKLLLTVFSFAVVGGIITVYQSFAAVAPIATNVNLALSGNECLEKGQSIYSSSTNPKRSTLRMQTDGNLVVYDYTGKARWNTGTGTTGGHRACMQTDGNFVVRNSASKALWQTYTSGLKENYTYYKSYVPSLYFQGEASTIIGIGSMQVDPTTRVPYEDMLNTVRDHMGGFDWLNNYGNTLYLDAAGGTASNVTGRNFMPKNTRLTSSNGKYKFIHQTDGNIVLYNAANKAVWYTGVRSGDTIGLTGPGGLGKGILGKRVSYAYIDGDVASWNVNVYLGGNKVAARLVMQDDGNLVLYGGDGLVKWNTKTNGK